MRITYASSKEELRHFLTYHYTTANANISVMVPNNLALKLSGTHTWKTTNEKIATADQIYQFNSISVHIHLELIYNAVCGKMCGKLFA